MAGKIYWALSLILASVWIVGFIAIDIHYQNTVANDIQRILNTTGAQGLYIMATMPILFYLLVKITNFASKFEGR